MFSLIENARHDMPNLTPSLAFDNPRTSVLFDPEPVNIS